jgi:hypothetical protein
VGPGGVELWMHGYDLTGNLTGDGSFFVGVSNHHLDENAIRSESNFSSTHSSLRSPVSITGRHHTKNQKKERKIKKSLARKK